MTTCVRWGNVHLTGLLGDDLSPMTPSKEPDMWSGSPKKSPVSGGARVSLPQPVWLQQLLRPPGGPMELPSRVGGHIMSRGDQHATGDPAEGRRQTCTGTQHPEFPGTLPLPPSCHCPCPGMQGQDTEVTSDHRYLSRKEKDNRF